jgi:hypothetical protein
MKKQLRTSSQSDQSVILMQILCSQLHTPLQVLKKNSQATYTTPKHRHIPTLSFWCSVPVFWRKERKCDKTYSIKIQALPEHFDMFLSLPVYATDLTTTSKQAMLQSNNAMVM